MSGGGSFLKNTLFSTLTAGVYDLVAGEGTLLERAGTSATLGAYQLGEKSKEREEEEQAANAAQ